MSKYLDHPHSTATMMVLNSLALISFLIGIISVGIGMWGGIISETSNKEAVVVFVIAANCLYFAVIMRRTAKTVVVYVNPPVSSGDTYERSHHG